MPAAKDKNMPRPQTSLRLGPEDRVLFGALMDYLKPTNFNAAVMWAIRKALEDLKLMPTPKALKAAVNRLIRKEGQA
jgi:hypothetical protein